MTGGMVLLVFTLVKAPDQGWGSARTIGELVAAGLLAAFIVNERRSANPLVPLSIFRVRGLAAANVTMLVAAAGIISMFFFLTLYMQNVLSFSPLQTGAAYLPLRPASRWRPGSATAHPPDRQPAAGGRRRAGRRGRAAMISRIPAHGTHRATCCPGMLVVSIGLGAVFVAITTAANAGVPPTRPGSRLRCERGAAGRRRARMAIFSAIATAHTAPCSPRTQTRPTRSPAASSGRCSSAAVFVLATAVRIALDD